MQRIKDQRLKILQHLQRYQEGGVTDLAGASTRQDVKHREVEISGNTADTDRLLDVRSQKRTSAKLEREGR